MKKNSLIRDIFLFILSHYLADFEIVSGSLLFGAGLLAIGAKTFWQWSAIVLLVILFILIRIAKFFILPIMYNFLEKKSTSKFVQKFVYNLKYKLKYKIILILFLHAMTLVFLQRDIFQISNTNIILLYIIKFLSPLILTIPIGLIGNYLVLFLYWYIKEKKQKALNTLSDTSS